MLMFDNTSEIFAVKDEELFEQKSLHLHLQDLLLLLENVEGEKVQPDRTLLEPSSTSRWISTKKAKS